MLVAIALICGVGLTTIVNVRAVPLHVLETGVTIMTAVTGALVLFMAVKALIVPEPLAARPIEVVLFVQL